MGLPVRGPFHTTSDRRSNEESHETLKIQFANAI